MLTKNGKNQKFGTEPVGIGQRKRRGGGMHST